MNKSRMTTLDHIEKSLDQCLAGNYFSKTHISSSSRTMRVITSFMFLGFAIPFVAGKGIIGVFIGGIVGLAIGYLIADKLRKRALALKLQLMMSLSNYRPNNTVSKNNYINLQRKLSEPNCNTEYAVFVWLNAEQKIQQENLSSISKTSDGFSGT